MVILQYVWTRRGLRAFEDRVADAVAQGWALDRIECQRGLLGLRWLCLAVFRRRAEGA